MQSSELNGVRAKVGWATRHFDSVNSAIKHFSRPKKHPHKPPGYDYQPERQQLIITTPKRPPLDPSLPLIVGDCIHNLRSALDHLVFQLALKKQPAHPAWTDKIAFPIYLSPSKFTNFVATRVAPFVTPEALGDIEKLQPYVAGNAGADDVLWALSQLDIIDKHRLLVIARAKFRPVFFRVELSTGHIVDREIPASEWKPMKDGAEIIRLDLSRAIARPGKVKVNIKTAHSIQLESYGLVCDGMELQQVLSDCINVVTGIVDDFGRKFFGEG